MNAPPTHQPPDRPDRLTETVTRLAARPRVVLLVSVVVAILGAALATRLQLRTAISELLPTNDPAVQALERTRDRVSDLSLLLVGIRSPDRQANLRYAAALTDHLSKLPPTVVELAAYHLRDLQQFIQKHRWLYLSVGELGELRDELRATLVRRKNPFALDLGDEPAPDARDRLTGAARAQQHALEQRFPDGYFVRGDYAWVATLPAGGMVAEGAGDRLIAEVRAFVDAHPPATFHPQMVVLPAGPVQSAIQNREAVERDILSVTVMCVFIIGLSLALYFRSKRWLALVVTPAMLGTVGAFAVAALAVGYLNSSTAFLGSIILGNGINYAIILGARYREHRRRQGWEPPRALQAAVAGVWRSTLAAALAAAAAYASLLFTGFRGFSQFGLMGAIGCLMCWLATFTVMPALILIAERRPSRAPAAPRAAATRRFDLRPHVRAMLIAAAGVTLLAVLGLRHFAQAPFEYDFRRLSTDSDHDQDYRQFDRNLDALFGSWHSPTVLLADRLDQVEPMRQTIRQQDRQSGKTIPYIGRVVTIYDVLPGTPAEQRQKLQLLADIRRLAADPATELLDEPDRKLLRENLPPADLRELGPMDLPPLARRPFTERDGTAGRALLAYHNSPQVSMWNGHDLLGIAGVLARLPLPDGSIIESSGPAMIFGGMLRSILRDGPLATGLSFLGVLLVVTLFVRPLRAVLLAIGGLLLGVLWMVGAAGHLGVRINFLNFIALPITFGIGVEYAVNVVARLAEGTPREPASAGGGLLATGAAVTLCSWTTIVGYGSLLAAHSRALRGFGTLAILGEIACLLAAVLVLPALYAWYLRTPRSPRSRSDASPTSTTMPSPLPLRRSGPPPSPVP
jgi:predicted RND superfamily exporter protein